MSEKPPEKKDFYCKLVSILEQVETLRGADFVSKITPLLGSAIQADYTFVARLDDTLTEATTLCLCAGSDVIDNTRYSLQGSPCQNVSDNLMCIHPRSVCELFPGDELLAKMGIEGYLGAPLHDPEGNVMGLVVSLFKTPVSRGEESVTLFKVFAGRIAAEVVTAETQQALEQELEKSQNLQEQYQLLAHQEREARHRAQTANNVKSAFVANMSHEVKTPMNAMLAFCQMLLKSELNQGQRLQVQSMLDSGQQLMAMLNDVLELSRLEEGAVELPQNQVETHELFDRVVEHAASQLQQTPIELSYRVHSQVPARVIIAEHYVQKVIANLLSNAIKFTARGDIYLDVGYQVSEGQSRALNNDAGTLLITVVDTGIGIAPDFIPDIFEPFTQQNSTHSRGHGGTGLGLHLAHRLVAMMGGSIDIKSMQGQGSAFTVRLPIRLPKNAERLVQLSLPIAVLKLAPVAQNNTLTDGCDNIAQHCLGFLGANILVLQRGIPLALQLAQTQVTGVVLDASADGIDIYDLSALTQEVAEQGVTCTVVLSRSLVANADCAELLGSVMSLRAPLLMHEWLSMVDELHPQTAPQPMVEAAGERILLVEDNRLNQEIALCILEDAGYRVDVAGNGQEAVDAMRVQGEAYRLILMDIQMPIMDGLEATRIIREQLQCKLPIVAVTAGIAVQDRQLCDEAGMDDFIPKPIDEDFVLQKVRYYSTGAYLA